MKILQFWIQFFKNFLEEIFLQPHRTSERIGRRRGWDLRCGGCPWQPWDKIKFNFTKIEIWMKNEKTLLFLIDFDKFR